MQLTPVDMPLFNQIQEVRKLQVKTKNIKMSLPYVFLNQEYHAHNRIN